MFLLISSIHLVSHTFLNSHSIDCNFEVHPYLGSRFETSSRDRYATGFCEFEEIMTSTREDDYLVNNRAEVNHQDNTENLYGNNFKAGSCWRILY